MYGISKPLPEVYNTSKSESTGLATSRWTVDVNSKEAAEAQELIQAGKSHSRTAYVIANLSLLNGLVDLRNEINPQLPLKFTVDTQPEQTRSETPELVALHI